MTRLHPLPDPTSHAFLLLALEHGVEIDPSPTIGQQIRVYRLARGWGQHDLAREARCGQPRVQEAEGGYNITAAGIHRLAKALGVALVALPDAVAPEPVRRAKEKA